MNNRLATFISITTGTIAGCFLYALVSLEVSARFPLNVGIFLARLLPHGSSHYPFPPDDSWWPWPSLERNGDRVPDGSFVQSATGILNLGQCVPIRNAGLILPGIVGTAILSVAAAYLLIRLFSHRSNARIFCLISLPFCFLQQSRSH